MIRHDAGDRYLARRDRGHACVIVTPEGVPIRMVVAPAGDRINAFIIDCAIIVGAVVVLFFLPLLSGGATLGDAWIWAFLLLAVFLLRNFYFTFFEIRLQGSTPGKRSVGIRVIDARGGPLGAGAVVARNLTRDLEVFLPLTALLVPEELWPGAPGWARLLASVWLVVFALLPLFNRERRRIGDLIAGTMVVLSPKAILLEDLAKQPQATSDGAGARHEFTTEQLDIYGIYELQVLEDLLRDTKRLENRKAVQVVCEKIKKKIRWDRRRWDVAPEPFLRDFYTALRDRLERRALLGKRRRDKHAKEP